MISSPVARGEYILNYDTIALDSLASTNFES